MTYNRPMPSAVEFLNSIPAPVVLAFGLALLLGGGYWLVDGAAAIAQRAGLSPLFVGLTIVAFGTSAPELFFNVIAAVSGSPGLSFGNVIGSNIANIALVLALAATMRPLVVHSRVLRQEMPQLIAVSIGLLVLAGLPVTMIVTETGPVAGWSRTDGIILLCGFFFFATLVVRAGVRSETDPLSAEAKAEVTEHPARGIPTATCLCLAGLVALAAGGKAAEVGASGVATSLGLSPDVVGLTIVAIATSLPEVVTSVIALRKGHVDIAVGNVVGSNLFNILLVLGATTTIAPVPVPGPWGWWDLWIMLGLTVVLLPLAAMNGARISRAQGILGLLIFALYLAFTVLRG